MALVIVDRGHPEVFDSLWTRFRTSQLAQVVWDRRVEGERRAYPRGQAEPSPGDRRGAPSDSWMSMHFVVVGGNDFTSEA